MCWQTNLAILVHIKPRAELIDQKNTRMGTFTFVTLTIVKPFEDPSKIQEIFFLVFNRTQVSLDACLIE